MDICKTLKDMRVKAGLTQSQLGSKIGNGGYKKHHVSAIENNNVGIGHKLLKDWQIACGVEPTITLNKIKDYKIVA